MQRQGSIYDLSKIVTTGMESKASEKIDISSPEEYDRGLEEYDRWKNDAQTKCQERLAKFLGDLKAQGFSVDDSTIEHRIRDFELTNVNVINITIMDHYIPIPLGRIEGPWIYVFDPKLDDFLTKYSL